MEDELPAAPRYRQCEVCARCTSGIGRRPDPTAEDCWDAHTIRWREYLDLATQRLA